MKELTIEQKAKAYDLVVERANELDKESLQYKIIESILHDKEESKDERIRKALIKSFEIHDLRALIIPGFSAKDVIAWLEKQCEQKSKFRVGDTIKSKYDDRQFTIKSVDLDKGTYTYTQEGCGNDIDYADEEFELVEQKPVAWSEEDEKHYQRCLNLMKLSLNTEPCPYYNDYLWLKSLKDRYTWKPSEEQMKALNYVVNLMASSESPKENDYYYNVFKDLRKQLKKLTK